MATRKLFLDCKNCGEEFQASYYPGSMQTYEHPGDPQELEIPEECPHCNKVLEEEDYLDIAAEKCADIEREPEE